MDLCTAPTCPQASSLRRAPPIAFRSRSPEGTPRVNIPDSPKFQLTHSLTLEAYVNCGPRCPCGRRKLHFAATIGPVTTHTISACCQMAKSTSRLTTELQSRAPRSRLPFPLLNTWFFVAGVLNDQTGEMDLYINGSLAASTTTTMRPFGPLESSQEPGLGIGNLQAFGVGLYGPGTSLFPQGLDGLIDEVRISRSGADAQPVSQCPRTRALDVRSCWRRCDPAGRLGMAKPQVPAGSREGGVPEGAQVEGNPAIYRIMQLLRACG